MAPDHWTAGGALLLCCIAGWWDLRHRRIPNKLVIPALVGALCIHSALRGGQGLLDSATGALVAGAILVPGYAMGFTGAGDVKLLMAVGAFLGMPSAVFAALLSLIFGGLLSVVLAAKRNGLPALISQSAGLGRWLLLRSAGVPQCAPKSSGLGIPLGIAIALATSVVVLSQWFGYIR